MDAHVKPYKVFIKDGVKIGVFGLGIALEGLVSKDLYKETKYLNPIEIAQDIKQKPQRKRTMPYRYLLVSFG